MWLSKCTVSVNPKLHDNGISPDDWRKMMDEIEQARIELQEIPRKYLDKAEVD